MKHAIYPERQGTIEAISANAAYPATNLTDNYRKRVWKAVDTVKTATLTIPISAISASLGAIAIFNTNATSATITITDTVTSATVLSTTWTISHGRYWQEFTPTVNALSASLVLTTTATTLEAGVIRAGDVVTICNPEPGVNESLKDYSIKKELRNGAYYTKKLEMVRTFSYSMMLLRSTEFRSLMDLYEYFGPDPFAMLIANSITDIHRWAVFGCFAQVPSASHQYPSHSTVSCSIEETV